MELGFEWHEKKFLQNANPVFALSVAAKPQKQNGKFMNKVNSEQPEITDNDMLPEYDFTDGVCGKYYQAYRCGHTVTIHQADETTVVQYFTLEDRAVMLDPDVQKYFPNGEAVNQALRTLISLFPKNNKSITPESVE